MMQVADIARILDTIAPPPGAADWDNVGLLIGDARARVRRVMLCIDLTADVLAEARTRKVQMVMAYHPVIFKPISRVTAGGATGVVYEAARRGVAVYSTHTALDVAAGGTNDCLAEVLGLTDTRAIEPAEADSASCKVVVFVPVEALAAISAAAFEAGAGRIGAYRECGFAAPGEGTFFGEADTNPAVGRRGRRECVPELRWESVCPAARVAQVLAAVRAAHPYEEPAIDVIPLAPEPTGLGMGRVGRLAKPVTVRTLLGRIKRQLGVKHVLTAGPGRKDAATKVAFAACGAGSCGSLFGRAAAAGATFFLTGEMRHHDALAADALGLTVACVGHSNSERITLTSLARRLRTDLPGVDVVLSERDRDPFEVL